MLLEATIRKMLVDGSQWATWQGFHLPVSEEYFLIWTPIGTSMHWRHNTWTSEKYQLTYFRRDSWYTIHIGYSANGEFFSGYCDVVLPQTSYSNTDTEMSYTDLYIDVVVRENGSVFTKDQEVYDRAAQRYPIVEQSRVQAYEVLDSLEADAKTWTGPFTIIPKQLTRTDFEQMSVEQMRRVLDITDSSHAS